MKTTTASMLLATLPAILLGASAGGANAQQVLRAAGQPVPDDADMTRVTQTPATDGRGGYAPAPAARLHSGRSVAKGEGRANTLVGVPTSVQPGARFPLRVVPSYDTVAPRVGLGEFSQTIGPQGYPVHNPASDAPNEGVDEPATPGSSVLGCAYAPLTGPDHDGPCL